MAPSKHRHPTLSLRKDFHAGLVPRELAEFEAQYGPFGADYGQFHGGFNTADQYSSSSSSRGTAASHQPHSLTNPLVFAGAPAAAEENLRRPAAARAFHHAKQTGILAHPADEATITAAGAAGAGAGAAGAAGDGCVPTMNHHHHHHHHHNSSALNDNDPYDPRLFDFDSQFSPPMLPPEHHSQSDGHDDTDSNIHMHNSNNNSNIDDFDVSSSAMADAAAAYGSCSSSSWDAPLMAGVPSFEPIFASYDSPQTVSQASPYMIEDLSPTGQCYDGTSMVLQPSSRGSASSLTSGAWSEHAPLAPHHQQQHHRHHHHHQYYQSDALPAAVTAIEPAQLQSHRTSRSSVPAYVAPKGSSSSARKRSSAKDSSSSSHRHSVETATSSARAPPQQASLSTKTTSHGGTAGKKTKKSSSSSSSSSHQPPAKASKSRSTTTATLMPEFRNPFDAPPDSSLSPQNSSSNNNNNNNNNNYNGNLFAMDGGAGAGDCSNTSTPPTPLSIVSHEAENKLVFDHQLEQYNDYQTRHTASSHRSSSSSSRFTPHHMHDTGAKDIGSAKHHRHHRHHDGAPQELKQQLPSSAAAAAAAAAKSTTTTTTTTTGAPASSSQRQRNRLAATKCRAKSRAAVAELEATERGMRFQHMELADTATKLKNEVLALKNEVLRHGNCDCVHIKEYLTNAARVIGGSMMVANNAQQSHGAGLRDSFSSTASVSTAGPLVRHDSACSADFTREYN